MIGKLAFATSAYDAGPAPTWSHAVAAPSGASYLPPAKVPRLDRAVQKTAEEHEKNRPGLPVGGLALTGGGAAAAIGGGTLARRAIHGETQMNAPFLDVLGDTQEGTLTPKGITYQAGKGVPIYPGAEAGFATRSKKVYWPFPSTHAGGLAHELGHADIAKSRSGRLVQNRATLAAGTHAPLVGGVTGGLSGMSDNPTVQRLGVAAPLLTSAPQLGYEAMATIKGLSRLRRGGASGKDLRHAMKALGPGFASYAGSAATGVGSALVSQRAVQQARFDAKAAKNKTAAGAPTRGNFMMASDIPSYRQPRLDRAIQKDGELETEEPKKEKDSDALPDGVVMQPWDNFKRSKYAMSTEQMAEYVDGLLKEGVSKQWVVDAVGGAKATPARLLEFARKAVPAGEARLPMGPVGKLRMDDAMTNELHRTVGAQQAAKRFTGADTAAARLHSNLGYTLNPKYELPKPGLFARVTGKTEAPPLNPGDMAHSWLRYKGKTKTAIPGLTPQSRLEQSTRIGAPMAQAPKAQGPSIADQAKPKGPGFGTGIAGANKGTIGGTNIGGIGNMAAVPQL